MRSPQTFPKKLQSQKTVNVYKQPEAKEDTQLMPLPDKMNTDIENALNVLEFSPRLRLKRHFMNPDLSENREYYHCRR